MKYFENLAKRYQQNQRRQTQEEDKRIRPILLKMLAKARSKGELK